MSEDNKKLGDEKLEHVAGGNDGQFGPIDDVHNTAYFSPHTVCNLPPVIIPRYQPMRASAVGAAKTLFSAC